MCYPARGEFGDETGTRQSLGASEVQHSSSQSSPLPELAAPHYSNSTNADDGAASLALLWSIVQQELRSPATSWLSTTCDVAVELHGCRAIVGAASRFACCNRQFDASTAPYLSALWPKAIERSLVRTWQTPWRRSRCDWLRRSMCFSEMDSQPDSGRVVLCAIRRSRVWI